MFKNASIFRITLPDLTTAARFAALADAYEFHPCQPSQERSVGWVPPRGVAHGPLAELIADQVIMCLMIETKTVPAQAIKDVVDAAVTRTEATTGRKPGKKERKELADDARRALLPHAFPKRSAVWVWIDPAAGLLVVDSASQSRTDEVCTQLVNLVDGIKIELHQFGISPASLMTGWLHDRDLLTTDDRWGFDVNRACELRANDESKAVVRYSRHALDTDEVKNHILGGKSATKLALTHLDRVAFTLTDMGTLAGIDVLDVVFEQHASKADQASDNFDADVAIITGELKPLIENLFLALDVQPAEGGAE